MTPQEAFHVFMISVFFAASITAIALGIERLCQKTSKSDDTGHDPLVPGTYISRRQASNPFRDDYAYITVLEVKDGWAKYVYGRDLNRPHANVHSVLAKTIQKDYEPYPFDKD